MKESGIVTDKMKALARAQHYCAYQERSQQEVRDKLYSMGLHSTDVEQLITELIQDNFLNEERFALAYARGKLYMKSWGKNKIKQGLKFKRVSDKLISKALKSLDAGYLDVLEKLLEKKAAGLAETDPYRRRHKLVQYAIARGFENDLIYEILSNNNLT